MTIEEFQQRIRASKQHSCLYHFTDTRNLPSIREHGLLSASESAKLGIPIPAPGGNEWSQNADKMFGMDAFVHLALDDNHPMEWIARQNGTIVNSKYLKIRPEVLSLPGVMATLGVANKSDTIALNIPEFLNKFDQEVIYDYTNWRDESIKDRLKIARKCEIIVPTAIPVELIMNLNDG